jgi:hypothetical protein
MSAFSHPFWPRRNDPATCVQSILLSSITGALIAVVCILTALARGDRGILQNIPSAELCSVGAGFGLLAFLVYKRSRIAAALLFFVCFVGGILVPEVSPEFGLMAVLGTFGAIRATVLLRPNTSLERTHEG